MAMSGSLQDTFVGSVTVGERGQVVIPAQARERCGIQPGDKLLAFVHPNGHGVLLARVDALADMAADLMALAQQGARTEVLVTEEEGE